MISRSQQPRPRFFFSSLVFPLIFLLSGCNQNSDISSTPSPDPQTQDGTDNQQSNTDNGTSGTSSPDPQTPDGTDNQPPIAKITAPNAPTSGQTVTLDGSVSSDPDGDNLSYQWTQTKGPGIALSNSSSSKLTFDAPTVSQTTQFTFQLTVGDGELSSSASVNIQVLPTNTSSNQQPTATISAPKDHISGPTVTLDGSGSSDPDGHTLSYQWTQTGGPVITISDSTSPSLVFIAPSVAQPTQFSFELTVHDGELSDRATVSVQISPIVDNKSPSVVSRSPRPDQSGVSTTAEIRVGFDEALLESSVDTQSFSISQNGSPVPGIVSYESTNNTATNKPASALSPDTTYTVTLANTLEDLAGNTFASESWSFSTGGADPCIACTDFESGDIERQTTNCSGTGTANIEEGQAHSGTKSLHIAGGGGYCNHIFARWPLTNAPSELWVRFWIRMSNALGDEHVTFLAMRDEADGPKDLRMGGQSKILMFNRESDDATLPALSPTGISLSRALTPSTWECMEIHIDQTAGTMSTYVNGEQVAGLALDGVPTPDIDQQWLNKTWRPTLSDLRLGWESYGGTTNQLWFDDLVVSADRPGCQ